MVSTWAPLSFLPSLGGDPQGQGSNLSSVFSFPATVYPGFHAGTASCPPPPWAIPSLMPLQAG